MSSFFKTLRSCYVISANLNCSLRWNFFTSQTFESCRFASTGYTKQCKTFTKLKSKCDIFNSDNFILKPIFFSDFVSSYWHCARISFCNMSFFFFNIFIDETVFAWKRFAANRPSSSILLSYLYWVFLKAFASECTNFNQEHKEPINKPVDYQEYNWV